jgi:hypothetical protein
MSWPILTFGKMLARLEVSEIHNKLVPAGRDTTASYDLAGMYNYPSIIQLTPGGVTEILADVRYCVSQII